MGTYLLRHPIPLLLSPPTPLPLPPQQAGAERVVLYFGVMLRDNNQSWPDYPKNGLFSPPRRDRPEGRIIGTVGRFLKRMANRRSAFGVS